MKKILIFYFGAFILTSCGVNHKNVESTGYSTFDKQGHRGCRGLMPENTIPAMIYAINLDVSTLEMDVHITRDSQVVLSHDPWFNTEITTKPDGTFIDQSEPKYILYNMNYSDIAKFDVGYKVYNKFPRQNKIHIAKPLLSTLIDSVELYANEKSKNIYYNIEIKSTPRGDQIYHPEPAKFVELLLQVINAKHVINRVIIQSFDVRPLQYLHTHYPAVTTSLLIEENDTNSLTGQLDKLGFIPDIYSPHSSLVTGELLKRCHRQNIRVIPWTVNDLQQMKHLKKMGVNGVISDFPDLFKQL